MRRVLLLALLPALSLLVLLAGCDSDETTTPTSTSSGGEGGVGGVGGSAGSGGEPVCGTGNLPLDEQGLTEISYDDGTPATSVREQTWAISTSATQTYTLNEEELHEAVRFDLEHPAQIYGFKVMWTGLPPGMDPKAEIEAGLYADFGHNGFDFWAPDPLWTGTRCAEDVVEGQWVTYVFDTPIVVDHPNLVYVAHRAGPDEPVWPFDATVEGEDPDNLCKIFDECQSSFNLPEAETSQYYNGLTFPFQYHFMARLLVEYTDSVQPADKLFQEIADSPGGRHVSWGDYDNDGWDDLLLGKRLWQNDGDGTFTEVTVAAGLDPIAATGGVWGDYDNDGCLDIFLFSESHTNPDTLMRSNCDGTFTDVTAAAGIVDLQSTNDCGDPNNTASPTAAAGWFDLDADGFLDLYLANFICWSNYSFYTDTVFLNQGDGTFADITGQNGFLVSATPSRGVAPVDHDGDGDIDVMANNYTLQRNLFFENNGDGTVSEQGAPTNLAGTKNGSAYGHTIGAAWGDLDNDGDFDHVAANLAHPRFFDFSDKTQILINDGSGIYADNAGDWLTPNSDNGLRYQETHSVPVLADIDQDGALDLAITCIYNGRPSDFYWGNGDGTFVLDAYHAGITTENGWGAAAADFDNDGDMDLFADVLFENTLSTADKGHWLQARAVGVTANRAALGATVKVTTGTTTRIRHVQGGSGKGGQDSLYLHFGLGDATSIDQIEVVFPGGNTVLYPGPINADQRVWLFEDSTTAQPGWADPS